MVGIGNSCITDTHKNACCGLHQLILDIAVMLYMCFATAKQATEPSRQLLEQQHAWKVLGMCWKWQRLTANVLNVDRSIFTNSPPSSGVIAARSCQRETSHLI